MWRWVLLLCVGCDNGPAAVPPDGDSAGDAANAPDADTSADATLFDPVRVVVYDNDGATVLPDTLVHFVAPDLSIQPVTTDVDGVAEASTPPGSTVIVFQTEGLGALVKAYVGVEPGNTIISGRRRLQQGAVGAVTFVLPSFPNAARYLVSVSCALGVGISLGTQPQVVRNPALCPDVNHATAVGWAVDVTGQRISPPSVFPNFNLQGAFGGTVQMPSYSGGLTTVAPAFTNLPAGATEVTWTETYLTATDTTTAFEASSPPAAQMTMMDVGDRTRSSLSYRVPQFGVVRVDQIDNARLNTFAFDASTMPRAIRSSHYDAMHDAITWEESPIGNEPLLVDARLSLTNSDRRVRLVLRAPYAPSRSIALPPLPPEVAFGPQESIVVDIAQLTIEGKTFTEMLETSDTGDAFAEPTFRGKVWTASD